MKADNEEAGTGGEKKFEREKDREKNDKEKKTVNGKDLACAN